jgi:hypothetical protein
MSREELLRHLSEAGQSDGSVTWSVEPDSGGGATLSMRAPGAHGAPGEWVWLLTPIGMHSAPVIVDQGVQVESPPGPPNLTE